MRKNRFQERLAEVPGLVLRGLYDLFLPAACFLCKSPLRSGDGVLSRFLCSSCRRTVQLIGPSCCPRCGERGIGRPEIRKNPRAGFSGAPRCARCCGVTLGFDRCAAGAAYGGAVKELVLRLKFSRELRAALPLGRLARMGAERALAGTRPSLVTAVPLHPVKRFRRGFNQAELIGRAAARELASPFAGGLIRRIRNTPSQGAGGGRGRRSNVRGAFVPTLRLHRVAASGRLAARGQGATVILVDDVVSSAATMDQCARALKAGGVATVIAAAAAT